MRRLTAVTACWITSMVSADLMIPDSGTGDRVMLFSEVDGSLIDANWITDIAAPFVFTTPKEAKVIGNEIWVSDQVVDAIHRFDLDRNFLGSITAHFNSGAVLDNIRGFGTDGTTVWITCFHATTANRGIVAYSTAGVPTGFFQTPTVSHSLFDVAYRTDELLISNDGTDDIERYSPAGAFLGAFALNVVFPQQAEVLGDGSVLAVSSISTSGIEGVYHYNTDGSLIRFIDTEPLKTAFGEHVPRAAWVLGNGDYLIATSNGVFTYNVSGNSFAEVLADVDAQFINPIDTGKPCPANIATGPGSENSVNIDDLLAVIAAWGPCPSPPAPCPADIVTAGASAGVIDIDDLLAVISAWGPCP